MLAIIPASNHGRDYRHIGMILNDTTYTIFLIGTTHFIALSTTVTTIEVHRLHQITEHKQLIIEYNAY